MTDVRRVTIHFETSRERTLRGLLEEHAPDYLPSEMTVNGNRSTLIFETAHAAALRTSSVLSLTADRIVIE